jgi:thiol-disulfide isomerase/thioredoxin
MKVNLYVAVFGIVALLVIIAAVSTLFFNQGAQSQSQQNTTLGNYGPAPNFQGISAWINSNPLNISKLRGKVVLVDFWTYSCINCIRTIPFLNALQSVYGNDGLVIVGVSTPEFGFEHNYSNVYNAVQRFGIGYPVALDNNYSTWDAYNNHYWPADYIVNKNGEIVYESFGESPTSFNQTQAIVRSLLESAGYSLPPSITNVTDALNFSQAISPEMYFGWQELESGRTNYFGNLQGFSPDNTSYYSFTNISQTDTIYLSGAWYNAPDSMIAESNDSKIFIVYRAKDVNVVASGNGGESNITVLLNGTVPSQDYLGSDVKILTGGAVAEINTSRLYNLVSAPSYGVHELEINASPGFRIYTFTFG